MAGSALTATESLAADCDTVPIDVETTDYSLPFEMPSGLMPDPQFDGLPAQLEVHRVRPVYADKCPSVPNRAVVLVHGRSVTGPVAFDLRYPAPGGGTLSVQEDLARAGIDTFAPSLVGYGRSTRFARGLDDPGNASLAPFASNGVCPSPQGATEPTIRYFRSISSAPCLLPILLADIVTRIPAICDSRTPMCGFAISPRRSTMRSPARTPLTTR
jgi:hypothetical protein